MPVLTRRRSPDAMQETWLVYYGDMRVGTIALRLGQSSRHRSVGLALWLLSGQPSQGIDSGTAATFDRARAALRPLACV